MAKDRSKDGKAKGDRPPSPVKETDDAAAQRRVSFLRHKLTRAMEDPLMRDQIVKAIRAMMTEGK